MSKQTDDRTSWDRAWASMPHRGLPAPTRIDVEASLSQALVQPCLRPFRKTHHSTATRIGESPKTVRCVGQQPTVRSGWPRPCIPCSRTVSPAVSVSGFTSPAFRIAPTPKSQLRSLGESPNNSGVQRSARGGVHRNSSATSRAR